MNHKKISIIIPSYSPSNYIKDCLDSISNQTLEYEAFEVLIILNGPKDPYWEFLFNLIKKYAFDCKLIYSEISGVSNARNIGLQYSSGEFIAFIDDDDYISPNYLSNLYSSASIDSIVVCNVRAFDNSFCKKFFLDGWLDNHKYGDTSDFKKFRSILSVPWAKLIPRAAIGNRTFDVRFANGEDSLFVTSITNKIKYLRFIDTFYFVRLRQGSASRKRIDFARLCQDSFWLVKEYICVYFSDYKNYQFSLFAYRIPGVIKNLFVLWGNSLK